MDEVKRIATLIIRYLIDKRVLLVGAGVGLAGVGVVALVSGPVAALVAAASMGIYELLTYFGIGVIPALLMAQIPQLIHWSWDYIVQALEYVGRFLWNLVTSTFGSGSGSGKEADVLVGHRIDYRKETDDDN